MYSDIEHERALCNEADYAQTVSELGAANKGRSFSANGAGVANLREVMMKGKENVKLREERLSASLTQPLCEKEWNVLQKGTWLNEQKDLNHRFNLLPPIDSDKRVLHSSMTFSIWFADSDLPYFHLIPSIQSQPSPFNNFYEKNILAWYLF